MSQVETWIRKMPISFMSFFFKLRDELGQAFVIVTHNEELAAMADRKLEMKDGVMV